MSPLEVDRSTDSSQSLRLSAGTFLQDIVVLVLVATALLVAVGTTAARAPAYAYDAPPVARVGVHEFGAVVASPGLFSDVREGSGSSPAAAQGASTTPISRSVATEAASAPRVVIGGMEDLGPGSIGVGEETLASRLPGDTGSRLGNWLNNRDVLRTAMGEGNPIRDASVDSQGNLLLEDTRRFITMERDFMRSFGWTYDPATTSWIPPG